MPCDTSALLAQAKCLECNFSGAMFDAASIVMLCAIRDGTVPSCNPQTLLTSANCILNCIPAGQMPAVNLSLLCGIASGQSPQTTTGLANWWRADTLAATVADGGAVGDVGKTWIDTIGAVAASQASAPDRPLFRATGLSGQPSVEFATVFPNAQTLLIPLMAYNGDFTVMGVFKGTITSGNISEFRILLNTASLSRLALSQSAGFAYSAVARNDAASSLTLKFTGTHLADR